jgi:ABC-type branched-subunit amino acid transport system substrate-binding protein
MPRYRLSLEDMADLIAYLEDLGREAVPGLSGDEIHLGCLLPPAAAAPEVGPVVRQTLEAALARINRQGGVFLRRLVLHVQELPESPDQAELDVDAFLGRVRPFALVGCYLAGLEGPIGRAVARHEIPLIGAITPDLEERGPADRWVFHVQSSLTSQGAALARFAATQLPGVRAGEAVILHADSPRHARVAEAVARAWAREAGRAPARIVLGPSSYVARLVGHLRAEGRSVVFALATPTLLGGLIVELGRAGWSPFLLAPSALSNPDLFQAPSCLDRRIFLGFPYLASDVTGEGSEELHAMVQEHAIGRDHQALRLAALASLKVLTEGLTRCGRAVDRSRLVGTLETLRRFETGFVRPLTFSPNEHVGSKGAHVLMVDLGLRRFRPVGGWISPGDSP